MIKKIIRPKLFNSNEKTFKLLENTGILRRFLIASEFASLMENEYSVKEIYRTNIKSGSHKLICVNYNIIKPQLSYHAEKEDFILISKNPDKLKNLYLLISVLKIEELFLKIKNNTINSEDFLIIKLMYNHPIFSFFTLNEDVPHCELTESSVNKCNPVFYITEPSDLTNNSIDLKNYKIDLRNINLNLKKVKNENKKD